MNRQQRRRINMKQDKVTRRSIRESLATIALGEKRKAREKASGRRTVVQGPGKMLTSRRSFKKPHGKPGWRVANLGALDQIELFGHTLGRQFDVTFHMTKGLRVVRVAA